MNRDILNRIEKLESRFVPSEAVCLIRMEDGSEVEMPVEEWVNKGHFGSFVRLKRGSGLHVIGLILKAIDEECGITNDNE